MGITDLFAMEFEDRKFKDVDEFKDEVKRFANGLIEDIGGEERYYLEHPEDIMCELDVEIGGRSATDPDEEEQEMYEQTSAWNDKEARKTEEYKLTKGE